MATVIQNPVLNERRSRLTDHREDMICALLLIELIGEEADTPKLENLVALGKMALGNKLDALDGLLSRCKELAP
ncbi:hypothetical protein [Bordetella genomosp. 7]|nr:hypothetical protein [Bordetella genomosp. 7]